MNDEIHVGKVVVLNAYGLRIDGIVEAILDDHGTPLYRVASPDLVLTVTKKQIVEANKTSPRRLLCLPKTPSDSSRVATGRSNVAGYPATTEKTEWMLLMAS